MTVPLSGASLASANANSFLEWRDSDSSDTNGREKSHHDNLYRYPTDDPKIHIKVGSIHSVKGQTHTATLVLETFWHRHNLESIKEWLVGEKNGSTALGIQAECRLKLHYVAMSRPTHLLCLAMKQNSFTDSNRETYIEKLKEYGWSIRYV